MADPASKPLDVDRSVLLMGSCFSDSVGARMQFARWPAAVNPCGVLYNPTSIGKMTRLALLPGAEANVRASIIPRDGHWVSWLCDSGARGSDPDAAAISVEERLAALHVALKESQASIVTFGTAWVYELASDKGFVVANCHKYPAAHFVRRRLSVEEIVEEWKEVAAMIREVNPDLRLIFTVSPIRHLKDGFEGNTRSKAVLQLACERICHEVRDAEYFPSYEILTDDLRDYRFYADDMVHPSSKAVEYIWEKFCDRYVTRSGMELLRQGERLTRSERHRTIIG